MSREREYILDFPVAAMTAGECVSEMVSWLESGERGKYVVCANPHSLEEALRDPFFGKALEDADLVVPDGIGIVIASRILGGSIRERVTGMDIFLGLSRELDRGRGGRYFFLGSTEENLAEIREKMRRDFPHITVAGTFSPRFGREFSDEEDAEMRDAINEAAPDLLWVGMTAPKQEKWIRRNRDRLNVRVIGAVGAVFDFYSGRVKRSHPAFQRLGLEWLPRLLREPRRLWRRNFISNPAFLFRVVNAGLRGRGRDG